MPRWTSSAPTWRISTPPFGIKPHAAANTRTGSGSWDGSARRRSFARTGCRWSHGAYSALAHHRTRLAALAALRWRRRRRLSRSISAAPASRQANPRTSNTMIMPPTMAARNGLSTLKRTFTRERTLRGQQNNPGTFSLGCGSLTASRATAVAIPPSLRRLYGEPARMGDQSKLSPGLADLDAMIARAEAACERGRRKLEARRWPGPADLRRGVAQQTMEDTLARLRAQRAAAAKRPR